MITIVNYLVVAISKEKFVRDKPTVNIGLYAGLFGFVFALASVLTYFYPDAILPAFYLLNPGTSSLRDSSVHTSRILLNGVVYGSLAAVVGGLVMKGKKILQN